MTWSALQVNIDLASPVGCGFMDRLLAAALDLFAAHGVSGTSPRMIADRAGVAAADVPPMDDLVLAVIAPAMDRMGEVADHAEAQRGNAARREAVLAGVVDLVIDFRKVATTLSFDPVVIRLLRSHPSVRNLHRVRRLLGGTAPDPGSRVRMAVISGGLMMAGADPAVAGLDDEDFRDHLLAAGRRILTG
jgi:AcrR family transcriptional regulator